MAYADYTHCDVCDAKAFYDANVDWEVQNTGAKAVLCCECAKTHVVEVRPIAKPAETRAYVIVNPHWDLRWVTVFLTEGQAQSELRRLAAGVTDAPLTAAALPLHVPQDKEGPVAVLVDAILERGS